MANPQGFTADTMPAAKANPKNASGPRPIPPNNELEFPQVGIVVECREQLVDPLETVVGLEAAGSDILDREGLPGLNQADLLLLHEMPGGIEALDESQVKRNSLFFGQRDRAVDGLSRIDCHDVDVLVRPQCIAIDQQSPILVGNKVGQQDRALGQEVHA